jgi:hypothetical protein
MPFIKRNLGPLEPGAEEDVKITDEFNSPILAIPIPMGEPEPPFGKKLTAEQSLKSRESKKSMPSNEETQPDPNPEQPDPNPERKLVIVSQYYIYGRGGKTEYWMKIRNEGTKPTRYSISGGELS